MLPKLLTAASSGHGSCRHRASSSAGCHGLVAMVTGKFNIRKKFNIILIKYYLLDIIIFNIILNINNLIQWYLIYQILVI